MAGLPLEWVIGILGTSSAGLFIQHAVRGYFERRKDIVARTLQRVSDLETRLDKLSADRVADAIGSARREGELTERLRGLEDVNIALVKRGTDLEHRADTNEALAHSLSVELADVRRSLATERSRPPPPLRPAPGPPPVPLGRVHHDTDPAGPVYRPPDPEQPRKKR